MKTAGNPTPPHIDPGLMAALKAALPALGSQAAMAAQMGVSSTQLSRALTNEESRLEAERTGQPWASTWRYDVADFEAKARSFLAGLGKVRQARADLLTTGFLVEPMAEFLDTVLHTRDIGVAWSNAGRGKTCGIEVYCTQQPLAIAVTARKSLSGWHRLRDAILETLPSKRRMKGESWDDFLTRTFQGSGRLLIVDNAHLLTESARAWLSYDWHEATGCPVALVGNPEIVAQWKRNDQHHSRVGLAREVTPTAKATDTVRALLQLHLPAAVEDEETRRLAAQVLRGKGAGRAVKKHLLLAAKLMRAGGDYAAPAAAFRAAHTQLLADPALQLTA